MVPFEPKTDSKEFEIADPEQSGSATLQPADITIRVWRRDVGGSAAVTWSSDSVLVYMVADLIAASQGRTANDLPNAMAAHFDNSLKALVAAKRIQNAILEFLTCRPGDYMGAAVLIHPPADDGFSQGMAQGALRLAEPGQIMLSEEVSRRLKEIPGLEFRQVPALTTGGNEHAGLSELIWTSPERLANLRRSASAASTPANPSPSFGATMIVHSPATGPRTEHRTAAQPIDAPQSKESGKKPVESVQARVAPEETAPEDGFANLDEPRSSFTTSALVVGAVVVVLIAFALAWFQPWSSQKPRQAPPVIPTMGAGTTETPNGTSGNTVTEPPVIDTHDSEPAKPPKKPKGKETKKQPEDTPIKNFEGTSTYDGMTQKDIPRLLQWAKSDQGNGNYTKAAQEYRVILLMQPNNPDAKEGLRKIQVAQGRGQ